MDPARFKEAYARLQHLDERLTYKISPGKSPGLSRAGSQQVEEKLRDLAAFTIELKEILDELFVAIASKPAKKS